MNNNPPERIYGWLDTQLSIARHYGGCTFQGARYVIAHDEPRQPLIRADVLKQEAKQRNEKAETEPDNQMPLM